MLWMLTGACNPMVQSDGVPNSGLQAIKVIGAGQFGKVYIAKHFRSKDKSDVVSESVCLCLFGGFCERWWYVGHAYSCGRGSPIDASSTPDAGALFRAAICGGNRSCREAAVPAPVTCGQHPRA